MANMWQLILFYVAVASASSNYEIVVGDIRVQALSPTLLRVEPIGPRGFEDRTTFMVTNRSFEGVNIHKKQDSTSGTLLTTQAYEVLLRRNKSLSPSCSVVTSSTDVAGPVYSSKYPNGTTVANRSLCCNLCDSDESCIGWLHDEGQNVVTKNNCWLLSDFASHITKNDCADVKSTLAFGCSKRSCGSMPSFKVTALDGAVLYDTETDLNPVKNLLHWPTPRSSPSYALIDSPRFFAPEWGVVPWNHTNTSVEPVLRSTNGYDFRNNIHGDTYVFLLGTSMDEWTSSRIEFLKLAGKVPLLPDYAYGTWWTWWHPYTETEAKGYLKHWADLSLPLDMWVMDSNWRDSTHFGKYGTREAYYNYPNKSAFPNYTEWYAYLREHGVHIAFIDHPFPHYLSGDGPFPVNHTGLTGLQTTPSEIEFRWQGLSHWLNLGLTFWWFDQNWGFNIPPPMVSSCHGGYWDGLDNAAWGSHAYFSVVQYIDSIRSHDDDWYGRPMILSKFGKPDWRPGMDPKGHAESPAQHRYPVWWTGDNVDLQASVESMVDAGLHDLKPFVHSDCGGDIGNEMHGTAGNLIRWTAHCAFGSILRFHGGDHRPWNFDMSTVSTIRSYLHARYRLLPALIAAGHKATITGMPLVARGDLFWPEHVESSTNDQYVLLDDILVAPIFDTHNNESSRDVWVPPGVWQDAWDGCQVTGPKFINVTQPFERIPMWHRREGGLIVIANSYAANVNDQDWSTLTLEAFPATTSRTTRRTVFERNSDAAQELELHTDGTGNVEFRIGSGPKRAWVLRAHLLPGECVVSCTVDGAALSSSEVLHLEPNPSASHAGSTSYFPLAGRGTHPAPRAGAVVEVHLPEASVARVVKLTVATNVVLSI